MDSPIEKNDRRKELLESESLARIEQVTRWLDDLIRIPILNVRIGLDPILGAFPWVGDTLTALFSLSLIGTALKYRVPKTVLLRMAFNIGFDYLLGAIPVIGDATDFFIKSNRWNLELLKRYAREPAKPRFGDYLFLLMLVAGILGLIAGVITIGVISLRSIGKL